MFDNDVRSYLTDEDRQEIAQEFYAKGAEAGFEKGVEKGIEQVAKKLKLAGIPTATISSATGLSEESVLSL